MSPGFTAVDNDTVIARLPEIDGTAVKVYLAIAHHADASGRCWPSQTTIARETGLSQGKNSQPRGVRNILRRLEKLGLIRIERRSGRPAVYHMTPAPPCRPDNGTPAPPCLSPRHEDTGDPGTTMPVTPAPPCLLTRSKNKIQEQDQGNKTKRAIPVHFAPPSINEVEAYCAERKNEVDAQAWMDYYEAHGWKFKGGQPMKNWKATVRNWERNGFSSSNGNGNEKANYRTGAGQTHDQAADNSVEGFFNGCG